MESDDREKELEIQIGVNADLLKENAILKAQIGTTKVGRNDDAAQEILNELSEQNDDLKFQLEKQL